MAVTVPGECGHALALGQLEAFDGVGHLAGAAGHIGPGVTVDVALDTARNHFAIAVVALCEINHRRNQQGLLLHQSEHGVLLVCI